MDRIVINLREEEGIDRRGEPVQLGIPFSRGTLHPAQTALDLVQAPSGEGLALQPTVTSRLQEGSVRWLLISFTADVAAARQTNQLTLQTTAPETIRPLPTIEIIGQADGQFSVSNGFAFFHFTPGEAPWLQTTPTGRRVAGKRHTRICRDNSEELCDTEVEKDWHIVSQGHIAVRLELSGYWLISAGKRLTRFACRLDLYAGNQNARLEVCIHNPGRACHSGGLWDLKDPGSIPFQALESKIAVGSTDKVWIQPEAEAPFLEIPKSRGFKLYQGSSGGESWDSQNHIDALRKLLPRFCGYTLSGPKNQKSNGLRAQLIACLESQNAQVKVFLQNFWQNFPSSVETNWAGPRIVLFPADAAVSYELHGGERKTQTIWLNGGDRRDELDWAQQPLRPTLQARHYQKADDFHWFKADAVEGSPERLIQAGLDSEATFFAKPEMIDEYGWRNFGDLFADHETLHQNPGDTQLISHYNNQYDATYGFARQYAMTGDQRCFELMDDLAQHVKDVDIYPTEEKGSDYNKGFFWHTDHYMPAHTSTRRTFSRHNSTSSTPGQTGGGPAAEHCYTAGLMYHVLMTGSDYSHEAILHLAGSTRAMHEVQVATPTRADGWLNAWLDSA